MKRLKMILCGSFFLLIPLKDYGNKIQINLIRMSNPDVSAGLNHPANFIYAEIAIQWENSWRSLSAPGNRDAAWIFLKYRKNGGEWKHARLHSTGHSGPTGCTIEADSNGVGAMLYRSQNGSGTVNWNPVSLRWNYGADGLGDNEVFDLHVFAIEMVHIPIGAFHIGEAQSTGSRGAFKRSGSSSAFTVSSESGILLGGTATNAVEVQNPGTMLVTDDFNTSSSQTLPDSFPKGFAGFYCMKYEISQQQYTDFLNHLTYSQQVSRTANSPAALPASGALSPTNLFRNGIDLLVSGIPPNRPAEYVCNLNNSGFFGTSTDGQWVACNYLSWADLAAYLDWSGLRPMTEWEYEKVCRGPVSAVNSEYAWGNTSFTTGINISNNGSTTEKSNNNSANVNCCNSANVQGPMRTGCMSKPGSTRSGAGASYYGVMDMSGNISEIVVSAGSSAGRLFRRRTGDGLLTSSGEANEVHWPAANASGTGLRGGNWQENSTALRVADRYRANSPPNTRLPTVGGRGVR